jgi:hypothetical protein
MYEFRTCGSIVPGRNCNGGFGLEILGLGDPVEVTSEVFFNLLTFPMLLEVTTRLGFLSLFGELAVERKKSGKGK